MPAAPVHKMRPLGWVILPALLGGLGCYFYGHPYHLLFIIVAVVIVWIGTIIDSRYKRGLAASRKEESICDFVRSFDWRKSDTWILRAVYEELTRFLSVDGKPVPVRQSDGYEKDLKIDPDDLDDLFLDIAFRARRSTDNCKRNPLYGKVKTVADIVTFLEHQPRLPNA